MSELERGTSPTCGDVAAVDCEFQLVRFHGWEKCENVLASVAILSIEEQSGKYFWGRHLLHNFFLVLIG